MQKKIHKVRLQKSHSLSQSQQCLTVLRNAASNSKERNVLQSTKLREFGESEEHLTSEVEMQSLKFVQLVFSVGLVQHFITKLFNGGRLLTLAYPWQLSLVSAKV